MSATPPEDKEPPTIPWKLCLGFVVAWLAVGLAPLVLKKLWEVDPGPWGDMFGMANSFFAALALLGLVYTVLLQMHELSLQRDELRLTRGEMAASTKAQAASARALALQVIISGITCQINLLQARLTQNRESVRAASADKTYGLVGSYGYTTENRQIEKRIEELLARLIRYDAELTSLLEATA